MPVAPREQILFWVPRLQPFSSRGARSLSVYLGPRAPRGAHTPSLRTQVSAACPGTDQGQLFFPELCGDQGHDSRWGDWAKTEASPVHTPRMG